MFGYLTELFKILRADGCEVLRLYSEKIQKQDTMNDNLNEKTSASQSAQIKAALLAGETLTPLDALRRFGCFRLGARIWELRHKCGMDIKAMWHTTESGKIVAAYSLNNV